MYSNTKEVKFTIGNTEIQKFNGSYLQNVIERDFDSKKELFDLMIGNTNEPMILQII